MAEVEGDQEIELADGGRIPPRQLLRAQLWSDVLVADRRVPNP
jgi:hypothetical protein